MAEEEITVRGVIKGCCGDAHVARAMLEGGVSGLADSRLDNLRRLREVFPQVELTMLRPAMGWELPELVELVDTFLVSSREALVGLAEAAGKRGLQRRVILMVETGGEREGIPREEFAACAGLCRELEGVELVGVGTHTSCKGENPSLRNTYWLVQLALENRALFPGGFPIISAGNSALWERAVSGDLPREVNELRIGEAILLGRETTKGEAVEGCRQGTFLLQGEIVEVKGLRGEGGKKEEGLLVSLGRLDIGGGNLHPLDRGLEVKEYYSDLCMVRNKEGEGRYRKGGMLLFSPDYLALVGAMNSPHVRKTYMRGGQEISPGMGD
jgi:predicted amino acid racemase